MVQNRNIEHEIILQLINGKSHVRAIAEAINEPHPTVSRKLSLLLQENAVNYESEGRNKVYFLKKNTLAKNYVLNAEHYKLTKLIKKYPPLLALVEDIQAKSPSTIVAIFGSYAKFIADKNSDIDIYIETSNSKVKETVASIHSKISLKIGPFDLHSPLIKEIIKNHVILKGFEGFYDRSGFFKETV